MIHATRVSQLSDAPVREREIFGTVRYMNASGLEHKFDIDAYFERVHGRSEH